MTNTGDVTAISIHVYGTDVNRIGSSVRATTRTDAAEASTGQGRLAAAGQWVLNEKRLTERAGLDAIQDRLAQPGPDLGALVSDIRARLELTDDVWPAGNPLPRGARGRPDFPVGRRRCHRGRLGKALKDAFIHVTAGLPRGCRRWFSASVPG
jgi:hypothetical protein